MLKNLVSLFIPIITISALGTASQGFQQMLRCVIYPTHITERNTPPCPPATKRKIEGGYLTPRITRITGRPLREPWGDTPLLAAKLSDRQTRDHASLSDAQASGTLKRRSTESAPPLTNRASSLHASASTCSSCASTVKRGVGLRRSQNRTPPSCEPVATALPDPGLAARHVINTELDR
jgi:hypothetical protein